MDLVTVYPEEGQAPRIARALLEAADDPRLVRVVSHPRFGFIVPREVFERFERFEAAQDHQEVPPVQTEPPKRRAGRPRKQTEPTESSEEQ
jgi:hypothetical protein